MRMYSKYSLCHFCLILPIILQHFRKILSEFQEQCMAFRPIWGKMPNFWVHRFYKNIYCQFYILQCCIIQNFRENLRSDSKNNMAQVLSPIQGKILHFGANKNLGLISLPCHQSKFQKNFLRWILRAVCPIKQKFFKNNHCHFCL